MSAKVAEGTHNICIHLMHMHVCVNEFGMQKMLVMELLCGGNLKNHMQNISRK